MMALPSGELGDYLTFRVLQQWFAVDVMAIFEVQTMVAISPVPDMPSSVLGMVNLRGTVVPVLDLRIRFGVTKPPVELTTPIIFIHHNNANMYGIVVDDVDDVIRLAESSISKTELQQRAEHLRGMTDYNGKLIMVLDTIRLLGSTLTDETIDKLLSQTNIENQ